MTAAPDAGAIRQALRCGRLGCRCGRDGGEVHCPAHDDAHLSLSLTERGGRVLVHCQAGCPQEAVLETLRARRLWPAPGSANGARSPAQSRRKKTSRHLSVTRVQVC